MDPEEQADLAMSEDAMQQFDDLAGGNSQELLPDDSGGGYAGFENVDDEGGPTEDNGFDPGAGDDWGETVDKQDQIPSAPTSSPPTARGPRPKAQAQALNATATDQDWYQSQSNWPKRAGKPENQMHWESNTNEQLNHAKMLIQKATMHSQDTDKSLQAGRKKDAKNGAVYTMIKKKMSITGDFIKALEDRHESVEDTIRQVGECLFQLQRAHRSKWSVLNICERRLELRDTRPLQELCRDHTQEALEHERQTLIESRQELSDQIISSREALAALDNLKTDVVSDLSKKRHGIRIDRQCLNPSAQTPATQERVVLPQLGEVANYTTGPSSPKDSVGGGSSLAQGEAKEVDTKVLIHRAVRMEEDAMKLCNESDSVMLQTKRECARASGQSQNSLVRRHDETADLKRKLEAQVKEIDEACAQTEMTLARTKKKLEGHEGPLKALDKQFASRGKQEPGVRDPVHEEMETHLETLKKSVKTLTTKFQNTKTLLVHLKDSREALTEDYRCKLLALKIEDSCLKVTARKAMELDRMDPRGGRCKVPSARQAPKKEGAYNLVASMPMDGMGEQVMLSQSDF